MVIQEIWSCLSQLRELRFDWCVLISDEGFKVIIYKIFMKVFDNIKL